jgi:enterochelin esterase family protein
VKNWEERTATWQHDPFNPNTLKVPEHRHTLLSTIELPSASPQPWLAEREKVAKGEITEARISSSVLGNQRTLWIYTPPGYKASSDSYDLLLLFDGQAYRDVICAPTTLDNLLADAQTPAFIMVLVDIIDFGVRSQELPCSPRFADFVANELLPWIENDYRVASDPARRIVGGFSLGGLAAAYFGLQYPDRIGKVLSQSGSFWWKPNDTLEHEWLTHQFAIAEKASLHFWLDVGLLEVDATPGNGPNMIVANRHMRDVLLAKGYRVDYRVYSGGHDYLYWRGALADALIKLTQNVKQVQRRE